MSKTYSNAVPSRVNNLLGRRFGRLLVTGYAGRHKANTYWRCRCDCGRTTKVAAGNLGRQTVSCGCYRDEQTRKRNTSHGLRGHKLYATWFQMLERCRCRTSPAYRHYGGRGIKVCKRWLKFENFLADMGERPAGGSLERKNNNGNYSPDNCRWASAKDQARNTRRNHYLTVGGRTQCVAAWAVERDLPPGAIYRRLRQGWSPERAIFSSLFPTRRKCF